MKYLFSIVALLICFNSFAQLSPLPQTLDNYQCIDTANTVIKYSFKFKNHSSQVRYNEDLRVVQIGKKIIKDYSEIVFHYDSLATCNFKKGLSTKNNPKVTFPCEIYSYPKEKKRQEKYRMILNAGVLSYSSEWKEINWIYNTEKSVLLHGYTCIMARTKYAGREYIAWYTLDVPVSYGPYKFYGLPGLIVKLEESSGMYVWEMYGLSRKSIPINNYQYEKEQECTEESAGKTVYKMMTTPMTFLSTAGSQIMVRQTNGSFSSPVKGEKKILYEPIELK